MILGHFLPQRTFSFDQLNILLGKHKNGGTWTAKGHSWLVGQGFEVEYWTLIDWPRFVAEGKSYLIEQFGQEVADSQTASGDIELEQARAAEALTKVKTLRKEPQIDDIKRFLDNGYLLRCGVNLNTLNGEEGHRAHSVVVTGYDEACVIIQDPGLPPVANRRVPFAVFEAAWAHPTVLAKEMAAIKLVSLLQ
jgi:hypothetical protein